MFIQVDETPNPETLKFLPGKVIIKQNPVEFKSIEESDTSPLAKELFQIEGVNSLYIGKDFVSVTKEKKYDWAPMKTLLLSSMMDYFNSEKPVLVETKESALFSKDKNYSDLEKKIIDLLETRVRPAVAGHGGDIIFHSYSEGIVELELQGSCSGCPSSLATLKMGVENMLKHYIPEVEKVIERT